MTGNVPNTGAVARRYWIAAALVVAVIAAVLAVQLSRATPSDSATPGDGPPAVLLIPGYGGNQEPLSALRASLTLEGYSVGIIDIGEGTEDLSGYAELVVAEAERMLADGAASVSSVGYSAGGVIGRVAAVDRPDLFSRVISIASPHGGTLWATLATGRNCPTACQQLRPGSDLLSELPDAPSASDWLTIYSPDDRVITPATSSILPGAMQLELPGLSHDRVPTDPEALAAVTDFLGSDR